MTKLSRRGLLKGAIASAALSAGAGAALAGVAQWSTVQMPYVNLGNWGISPNGSNQAAQIQAAFAANAGREVRLKKGTFIYDSATFTDALSGTKFLGEGDQTILSVRGSTGTRTLLRAFGQDVLVDAMKIQIDAANAGTSTFIIVKPGNGGKNLWLGPNLIVDGSLAEDGSSGWVVHVVSPDGTTNFTGIWCEGEWHHMNRAWLKANTDTGAQNMLRFTNKLYLHDMLAEPIALNTPSGRVYDIIMEHTSRDLRAASSAHIAVGSSEGCKISAKVYGKGKRAFHFEEGVRRAQLIGAYCEMTDVDAIGVFFADNNIHLATQPLDVLVQACQLKGPGSASAGSIGLNLGNDGTIRGPVDGLMFMENIIEDWEKGLGGDDLALNAFLTSNLIRRCGTGFNVPLLTNTGTTFLKDRINRNRLEDVPVPFDSGSGSEAFWGTENKAGFDEFMGATLWVSGGTAYKPEDVVSYSGRKYQSLTIHTSGATAPDVDTTNWKLIDRWTNGKGSDSGTAVAHQTSLVRLTTGSTNTTAYATNGVQRAATTPYLKASLAPIRVGFRIKADNVTSMAFSCGLTDDGTTFEQPIGVDATTTQVNAATDAVVLWFSTGVTVTNWQGLGVKAGVAATKVDTAVVPVAATYQMLEIAIDTSGNATFYINGTQVGTMANAVTPTVALTPFVNGKARGTSTRLIDYEVAFVRWG